jgi:hypothetical protein
MCSDPWPCSAGNEIVVKDLVNYHARAHGFTDWVEAYHAAVPCALCDRGDGQLGHAEECQKNPDYTAKLWSILFKTDEGSIHPKRAKNPSGLPLRRESVEELARDTLKNESWLIGIEDIYPITP